MTNQLLDAALRYADDGWLVFPIFGVTNGKCDCGVKCGNEGKHPLVAWSTQASNDPGQISRWWKKWPNANVGVVTGARSGIYVIDIDNKKSVNLGGGTLIGEGDHSLRVQSRETGNLPETLTAVTGSGGTHLIFSYPMERESTAPLGNRAGLLPSVDTRGDGGYIVAAPSLHVSGNRYRWVERDQPLSPLPDPWLRLVQAPATAQGKTPTDLELPDGFVVQQGEGRHEWLFRMGAKLRGQHGLGSLALFGSLSAYNRRHVSPPLEPREIEHIVESCLKYEPGLPPIPVDTSEPVLVDGDDLAELLFDFLAEEPTPFTPLVSHLLHSGECMILGGPPNVGKTWATMDMMLGIASGTYFANHFNCEQANVLFIDEEGSRRGDWERFTMLLSGRQEMSSSGIPLYTKIDSGIRLDQPKGHTQLARLIERYKPGAVFLDSLVRVHGGDESNNRSMAELFRVVKTLMTTYNTSFIFTHHIRKPAKDSTEDPMWMLRGASDIQGFPDSIAIFLPGEESTEVRVVHTKMRNSEKLKPFVLRIVVDDNAQEAKIGYLDQEKTEHENQTRAMLIRAVSEKEGGWMSLEELALATGLATKTVADHMRVLGAASHINSVKRGGTVYYQVPIDD